MVVLLESETKASAPPGEWPNGAQCYCGSYSPPSSAVRSRHVAFKPDIHCGPVGNVVLIAYVNHSNQTGDLYIDGVAEITGASSSIDSGTFIFQIDNFMRGFNAQHTSGLLDDVRIYDN